jgi:hypothetical protein
MKHLLFILAGILAFHSTGFSQNDNDKLFRKYSNEFLSIGVGARALGMGNSCVASTSDVTSGYWNPANLSMIPYDMQLGAMHAEYFAGIGKFDYLGTGFKLKDSSAVGISLVRFGVDDIPNTLDLIDSEGNIRYTRIKSFSVADYAFLFTYSGKAPIDNLYYGANVKIIRRVAGEFASAWGFGFDLAARYHIGALTIGAIARDVTTTFNAWKFNTSALEETFAMTGNELPENSLELTAPKLILAAAYAFEFGPGFGALAEVNMDVNFDGKRNVLVKSDFASADPHLGLEFNYKKLVYLRAGISNLAKIPNIEGTEDFSFQPSVGIGLKVFRLNLDYAFTDIGDQSIALYSHVVSLSYGIQKKTQSATSL